MNPIANNLKSASTFLEVGSYRFRDALGAARKESAKKGELGVWFGNNREGGKAKGEQSRKKVAGKRGIEKVWGREIGTASRGIGQSRWGNI